MVSFGSVLYGSVWWDMADWVCSCSVRIGSVRFVMFWYGEADLERHGRSGEDWWVQFSYGLADEERSVMLS